MQVHCGEGRAIHTGPEPCGVIREDGGEASAGESIGQPLSHEIAIIPGADAVSEAEGHTIGCALRASGRPGVVGDPGMCRRSLRGNREISRSASGSVPSAALVRIGKARSRSR